MKELTALLVVLMASNALAGEACSKLNQCEGSKLVKQAHGSWKKMETGVAHNLTGSDPLCLGANFPSIGVEFSDGVRFVASAVGGTSLQRKLQSTDENAVVEGMFFDSHDQTRAQTAVSLDAKALWASALIQDPTAGSEYYYEVACYTQN